MGRFLAPLKTNLHIRIISKDNSKRAANAAYISLVFKPKGIKHHDCCIEISNKIYLWAVKLDKHTHIYG
jgi:hypothetical protein